MPTKANLESKTLQKGVVDLVISILPDDLKPHLERGSLDLQKNKPVAGFRPGKAPLSEVTKTLGAMAVWEAAAKYAVADSFADIMKLEKLDSIGDPEFQLLKLTPGQPLQYSAKIALRPDVEIGNYQNIKVKTKAVEVDTAEVDKVIDELRDLRAQQTKVERAASKNDRVIVDLNMSHGAVPLEGGQAKDHTIDLFRPYFIEGFAEQIVGMSAGDDKTFPLTFPTEHYDKKLAGKKVDFAVHLKEVQEYVKPEVNDEFAKSLGNFQNVEALRQQIKDNLQGVQQEREDQRVEREIIDSVISLTKFGDIPEVLVDAELQKIFWRLKARVESEGGSWNDYLEHLKKTPEELIAEWRPEAETRVKANLVILKIAELEKIEASDQEIKDERQAILAHYNRPEDSDVRREVEDSDYDKHLRHLITTRKVVTRLKELATK